MRTLKRRGALVALPALLAVGACSTTPPTRFYTLAPVPRPGEAPARRDRPPIVGLGPISFPDYLDRPQIVTRVAPTRLEVSEFDTWAEPLEAIFARTVQENLSRLLRTENILLLPITRDIGFDTRVEIEVLQYDADSDGNVVLDARWRLIASDGKATKVGRSTLGETVQPAEFMDGVTMSMSNCLGGLSRQIADAVVADIAERSVGARDG